MAERPTGTVTFLFTDIEQSTRRRLTRCERPWHDTMPRAWSGHSGSRRLAVQAHRRWRDCGIRSGTARDRSGDCRATCARASGAHGICTSEVESRDEDYFGPALNRAARTMAAAHGGQIVVAASSAAAQADRVTLDDLGEYRLRDLSQPQRLYQVRAEGLRENFPPLRTLDNLPGNLPAPTTSF